jgi:hypothetical protein
MSTAISTVAPTPARRAMEQLNFLKLEFTLRFCVVQGCVSLGDLKDPSSFIFRVRQSVNLAYWILTPSKRR